ncbi:acyltransferase family protein [Butyrivibrio sp. LC3010]|uniref:acyltransferase family protein n=1 Tax=Butyrivibrio sp. LC3010 TaxID=1280680 RepID=UPI000411ACD4|nr:acyltransferase [Butyrivibrio sp. LC3010]
MKNNNFTIIHIAAAFMVLMGHQFVLLGSAPLTLMGMDLHGLGVRVLFMVSGFLVSASYMRSKNPAHFLWKRLSRLYPPLIVCLALTIIVFSFISNSPEYYWHSAKKYFIYNITMRPIFDLAGVFSENPYPSAVNGSLWTLPIEIAWYFALIPVLGLFKILKRYSDVVSRIFLVVLLCIMTAFDFWITRNPEGINLLYWNTDWKYGVILGIYFMIGVTFQMMNLKKLCNMQIAVIVILVYTCLAPDIKYILTPYVVSYVVLSFALVENPLFAKYIKKDICYGLYLYAFPVQQLLIYEIYVRNNTYVSPFMMGLISAVIVLVIAVAEFYLIEEKIWLNRLKAKLNNR